MARLKNETKHSLAFFILCLTACVDLSLQYMYWYIVPLGIAGILIFNRPKL